MSASSDYKLGKRLAEHLKKHPGQSQQQINALLQDLVGADQSLVAPLRDLLSLPAMQQAIKGDTPINSNILRDSLLSTLSKIYQPKITNSLKDFIDGYLGISTSNTGPIAASESKVPQRGITPLKSSFPSAVSKTSEESTKKEFDLPKARSARSLNPFLIGYIIIFALTAAKVGISLFEIADPFGNRSRTSHQPQVPVPKVDSKRQEESTKPEVSVNTDIIWPSSRLHFAHTAKSSESIPQFPDILSGYKQLPEGKDWWSNSYITSGSLRLFLTFNANGIVANEWTTLNGATETCIANPDLKNPYCAGSHSEFPKSMNSCHKGQFMLRWRTSHAPIRTAVGYFGDVQVIHTESNASDHGYMQGNNCSEPLFRLDGDIGDMVDIFYEIIFWKASP